MVSLLREANEEGGEDEQEPLDMGEFAHDIDAAIDEGEKQLEVSGSRCLGCSWFLCLHRSWSQEARAVRPCVPGRTCSLQLKRRCVVAATQNTNACCYAAHFEELSVS